MQNLTAVIITIVLLALLGGGAYFFTTQTMKPATESELMQADETMMKDDQPTEPDTMMQNDQTTDPNAMMEDETSLMEGADRYLTYTPNALSAAANSRRVLFFYANWCPTCKPADANFQENVSKIPADVTVFRVNYNDTDTDQAEKDLAKKYGITYQHTYVQIDANGNEVAKWNGGQIDELLANIL